jgi:hypothetical protein
VYLQFSISDAYASREAFTQFRRALARSLRVWWEGLGCGFPLLAPILAAVACEKLAEYEETPWDFAEDCLVTHGPIGSLNAATGIAGLAAMLWLYGVAWYQPMGESLAWVRATVTAALPTPSTLVKDAYWRRGDMSIALVPADGSGNASAPAGAPSVTAMPSQETPGALGADAPIDPEIAALFTARNKRLATLKAEGPRLLEARDFRQAAGLCRHWADLELGNADAWRCLGRALEGLGRHREAVSAFRKAKQYDPADGSIDAAINRSQSGIVADFLRRRGS